MIWDNYWAVRSFFSSGARTQDILAVPGSQLSLIFVIDMHSPPTGTCDFYADLWTSSSRTINFLVPMTIDSVGETASAFQKIFKIHHTMADDALQDQFMAGMEDNVKVHDFAMKREDTVRPVSISPPVTVPHPPQSTSKLPYDLVGERHQDTPPSNRVETSKTKSSPSPSRKTDLPYSTFYSPRWNLSQNTMPPPPKLPEPHLAHWSNGVLGPGQENKEHKHRNTRTSDNSKFSAYSTWAI
jgi:hypothetical protein